MFSHSSDRYEALLVTAAGRSALADCAMMALQVGASAGDGHAAPPREGGEKRLSTNLHHLKRCREVTAALRNAQPPLAPPYEARELAENARLDRYGRVAEVLANATNLSPQQRYADAAAVIAAMIGAEGREGGGGGGGFTTDEMFDVLSVLLKVQQSATTIIHGEVSIPTIHLQLDLAVAYVLGNNTPCALMHVAEARAAMGKLVEVHAAKAHLEAKLLFAEALALVGTDARKAHGCAKAALDTAERLYTPETGLQWYRLLATLTAGAMEGEHNALLASCDEVLGAPLWPYAVWALVPLLRLHCSVLLRADRALREPAVANARRRLLEAVRKAATKADLEQIEHRLRADAASVDEKARTLKLTVVRQCDQICGLCDAFLRRGLVEGGSPQATLSGLVAVVGSRAALRVDRLTLSRRFSAAADELLSPQLGVDHPLVSLNRITLGSRQLFRAQSTHYALIQTCGQLALCPPLSTESAANALSSLGTDRLSSSDVLGRLEETFGAIMAKDTPTSRDFGPLLSCIAVLHQHYADEGAKLKVRQMLALWCDALCDFVGPQHPLTLAKVDEYVLHRNALLPPHFSPSGGVVPLLTPVTVTCDTADGEVFVSYDGDVPINAEGVNTSRRYGGPIVLDRAGTVVLKATAFGADGGRSACTETRFVVTPLTA